MVIRMNETMTVPSFLLHIQSELSNLTKTEKRVAEYVLNNPNNVLHLSLIGLAENCKTSDATVIRTFRKLGMTSFHEFKISLAQSIVSPLKMANSDIDANDSAKSTISKIYNGITNTIIMTRDLNQDDKLVEAAQMLYESTHIYICGMGNSNSVASDFYHKMLRLGLRATYQQDIHLLHIDIGNFAKPDNVFFIVSHSGSSKLVVEVAQFAKKKGVKVISLSDVGRSPIKDISDICLCTISDETKFNLSALSSKIAEYAIIDVLFSLISFMHPQETVEQIKSVNKAMTTLKY